MYLHHNLKLNDFKLNESVGSMLNNLILAVQIRIWIKCSVLSSVIDHVLSFSVVPAQIQTMVGTTAKGRWLGGMVAGGAGR